MNAHPTFKSELRPLPMRITQLQFERLHGARSRDGLSVQEHVRRALDQYLTKLDKDAQKVQPTAEPEALQTSLNGDTHSALTAMPLPARKGPKSRPVVRQR